MSSCLWIERQVGQPFKADPINVVLPIRVRRESLTYQFWHKVV